VKPTARPVRDASEREWSDAVAKSVAYVMRRSGVDPDDALDAVHEAACKMLARDDEANDLDALLQVASWRRFLSSRARRQVYSAEDDTLARIVDRHSVTDESDRRYADLDELGLYERLNAIFERFRATGRARALSDLEWIVDPNGDKVRRFRARKRLQRELISAAAAMGRGAVA